MHDQRKNERAPIDVYLNKIIDEARHLAKAHDISADGIWVSKILEPNHGSTTVGLELQLPGSPEVINAVGEIVREDRRLDDEGERVGTAIRFTQIAGRYRRLIELYVSRNAGTA